MSKGGCRSPLDSIARCRCEKITNALYCAPLLCENIERLRATNMVLLLGNVLWCWMFNLLRFHTQGLETGAMILCYLSCPSGHFTTLWDRRLEYTVYTLNFNFIILRFPEIKSLERQKSDTLGFRFTFWGTASKVRQREHDWYWLLKLQYGHSLALAEFAPASLLWDKEFLSPILHNYKLHASASTSAQLFQYFCNYVC